MYYTKWYFLIQMNRSNISWSIWLFLLFKDSSWSTWTSHFFLGWCALCSSSSANLTFCPRPQEFLKGELITNKPITDIIPYTTLVFEWGVQKTFGYLIQKLFCPRPQGFLKDVPTTNKPIADITTYWKIPLGWGGLSQNSLIRHSTLCIARFFPQWCMVVF